MKYTILEEYRQDLYQTFERSPDVLMDIIDSLIWESRRKYPIDLTCAPTFRRQWSSFYKGLRRGRFSRKRLRGLACTYYPRVSEERLVLIIDATSILRPLSPTVPNRQYVHTAAATTPDGKPVGIGWQFALLVGAPATPSSWTHILDCTRIPTNSTPAALAIGQLKRVLPDLVPRPLVLGDRYYGSVTFVRDLQPLACDGLLKNSNPSRLLPAAPASVRRAVAGASRHERPTVSAQRPLHSRGAGRHLDRSRCPRAPGHRGRVAGFGLRRRSHRTRHRRALCPPGRP